jgi:glycosyltransferase involved in cell wall biosynthesis
MIVEKIKRPNQMEAKKLDSNSEKYKLDVSVATKNNARTIHQCLTCIKQNLPVNRLIVVDGGSHDGTTEIARAVGAEVITETGLLGKVRHVQAEACTTDWIIIVDSDVYVYPDWWSRMNRYMTDDIAIAAPALGDVSVPKSLAFYYDFMVHNVHRYGAIHFSNALVNRKTLLSCVALLNNVHAGEDGVFATYANEIGKRVVTVREYHLMYHDTAFAQAMVKTHIRSGQSMRMLGQWKGLKRVMKVLRSNVMNYIHYARSRRSPCAKLFIYIIYLWILLAFGFALGEST